VRHILSIQGGGIRGIIPCLALAELEGQLGGLTRDHIDLCAGTSTGALLTTCVAAGISASAALKVYTERGPDIFSPHSEFSRRIKLIADGHMFDNKILHQVVLDTLGAAAGMKINDCPIRVLITAVDMAGKRWFFVRDNPKNAQTTGKYPLVDAAVASACATTYHGPWIVPGAGFFFDGGTGGLADPIYHAAVEAFYYDDFLPPQTKIVNLGTGSYAPAAMPNPPTNLLQNISWVTSSLVSSSKSEAQETVERQWPGITQSFNPAIPSEIDEADVDSIPKLLEIGKAAAAKIDWKTVLKDK